MSKRKPLTIANRFRGFLPIVVDVETSGLDASLHALLEIATVTLTMDARGRLHRAQTFAYHIDPFPGMKLDPEALAVTGIDPGYPLRFAIPERQALHNIFVKIHELLAKYQCHRAVLVGHNVSFDLAFIQAAIKRSHLKSAPIHAFMSFDTATLAALSLGETVLARSLKRIRRPFDVTHAHSAIYDAEATADLFCHIVNQWQDLVER